MSEIRSDATVNRDNVLKGPPGLLFGLTLLVFVGAGLYFGKSPDALNASEKQAIANDAALIEQALKQENARRLERNLLEP